MVNWLGRQLERLRSFNPLAVDSVLAVVFTLVGIATSFGQDISDDEGFREPTALLVVTAVVICAPIAIRRRWPLMALVISAIGIVIHLLVGWPEGWLPLVVLLLTFTVGARCPLRRAVIGLAVVCATIAVLAVGGAPTFDTVGAFAVLANFAAVWALGVAFRNRRAVSDARVREADERAEAEHQRAARMLAEERLRIAQELHDVVAHSMSVIAVQAGVGEHVLDEQPEQARCRPPSDLRHVARDAHRDAPPARRAARQRRRPIVRPGSRSRRPAPARRRRARRWRTGDAARRRGRRRRPRAASSCPPTGSCRRR